MSKTDRPARKQTMEREIRMTDPAAPRANGVIAQPR
jgi:hypothetical protein